MVICTLGDTSWRFGSAPSDGGGLIPIRGLTFSGHSSNGVVSGGQESCAPGLSPQGLEENYEEKVKAREGWNVEEPCSDNSGLEMSKKDCLGCRQICFSSFDFLSHLVMSRDDVI